MSKNYYILIGLLILLALPLVTSQIYQQGEDVLISRAVRIGGAPSASIVCNITVEDPDSTIIISYAEMTNNAATQRHEFLFAGGNTSEIIGEYCYELTCSGNGQNATESYCFEATPDGTKPDTPQGIIYIGVIVISFIAFMVCLLWCFNEQRKYLKLGLGLFSYILLSWLLFVLWQLSHNYLMMAGLASILRIFWWITMVGMFPAFILAFLLVLAEIKNDNFTQHLLKRGLPER